MALGVLLLLGGCCLLLLAVWQVHALWCAGRAAPPSPRAERPAPVAATAWAPFVVGPGTCRDDLKRQYRALARRYHPDCGGDPRLMAALNARFAEVMRHHAS